MKITRAGAAAIAVSIAINTAALTITDIPAALTELAASTNRRAKVDLTNAIVARITARVTTAGSASAEIRAQYSLDESTWDYLDGSSGPAVNIATLGTKASGFVALAAAAKADVFVRVVTINGDGAADPQIGSIYIQVK
jgi:hypothetical protein